QFVCTQSNPHKESFIFGKKISISRNSVTEVSSNAMDKYDSSWGKDDLHFVGASITINSPRAASSTIIFGGLFRKVTFFSAYAVTMREQMTATKRSRAIVYEDKYISSIKYLIGSDFTSSNYTRTNTLRISRTKMKTGLVIIVVISVAGFMVRSEDEKKSLRKRWIYDSDELVWNHCPMVYCPTKCEKPGPQECKKHEDCGEKKKCCTFCCWTRKSSKVFVIPPQGPVAGVIKWLGKALTLNERIFLYTQ
ncbi:unnamed protein product, partial [Allacma fusca]